MLICEICFSTTREMPFENLNIEKELSLWLYLLQLLRRAQGLAYPFSCGHTFFCFLDSLSWNRKPDVLFTGLLAWEVSDCVWEGFFCRVCGGWDKVCVMLCRRYMTFGLFDLISTMTCSHHLSSVLEWKFSHLNFSVWLLYVSVACSSFLCLITVR